MTKQLPFWDTPKSSQGEDYSLDELKTKLIAIKGMGYIHSVYLHAGGIGNTLESLLGVEENNLALPDLGNFELKARRKETGSMMTLFTKSPNKYSNAQLLSKYGYTSGGQIKLHQTIYFGAYNAQGYILKKDGSELQCWNSDNCLGTYSLDFLNDKFLEKVGDGVILALAKTRTDDSGHEEFYYQDAYLLGKANFNALIENLRYDIRIGRYPNGSVHDHGSAFRVRFDDLSKIFGIYEKLI